MTDENPQDQQDGTELYQQPETEVWLSEREREQPERFTSVGGLGDQLGMRWVVRGRAGAVQLSAALYNFAPDADTLRFTSTLTPVGILAYSYAPWPGNEFQLLNEGLDVLGGRGGYELNVDERLVKAHELLALTTTGREDELWQWLELAYSDLLAPPLTSREQERFAIALATARAEGAERALIGAVQATEHMRPGATPEH